MKKLIIAAAVLGFFGASAFTPVHHSAAKTSDHQIIATDTTITPQSQDTSSAQSQSWDTTSTSSTTDTSGVK